jgi:hypothetical protein
MPETCFGTVSEGYAGTVREEQSVRIIAGHLHPRPGLFRRGPLLPQPTEAQRPCKFVKVEDP